MSIKHATAKLQLKNTTVRNIINLWRRNGRLYPNDIDKAKDADSRRLRQLAKSTRRLLMIAIDVPDGPKLMVKIERPAPIKNF